MLILAPPEQPAKALLFGGGLVGLPGSCLSCMRTDGQSPVHRAFLSITRRRRGWVRGTGERERDTQARLGEALLYLYLQLCPSSRWVG